VVTRAFAGSRRSPTSIVTSGLAATLWYQSGLVGAPPFVAKMTNRSSLLDREEQERSALEVPADLPVVRAELLDDPGVPILSVSHAPSSCDRDGSEPNPTKGVPTSRGHDRTVTLGAIPRLYPGWGDLATLVPEGGPWTHLLE
jgi:hypothetical protein